MKKSMIFKILVSFAPICFVNLYAPFGPIAPPPTPEEMEEMFKDIDIDEMLKDLEGILKKEKEKPKAKKIEREKPKTIKKVPSEPKKTAQKKIEEKKDPQTLFLKDFEITQEQPKLPKEQINAYTKIMKELTDKLNSLQNKIDSFEFGIVFKEMVEDIKFDDKNYKDLIGQTKIAKDTIPNKKIFLRYFFSREFSSTRKNIISMLPLLRGLGKAKTMSTMEFNLLFEKLQPITQKLATVEKNEETQKKIEEKIKKRLMDQEKRKKEREAQKAKAMRGKKTWETGRARTPGHWYPPSFGGPDRQFDKRSGYSSERKFEPTQKLKKPEPSLKDEKPHLKHVAKEKKETVQIVNLIKNITKVLNEQIVKIFAKKIEKEKQKEYLYEDERVEKILKSGLFADVASKLHEIEKAREKLSKAQLKNLEKSDSYKKADEEFKKVQRLVILPVIKCCKYVFEDVKKEKSIARNQKQALAILESPIKINFGKETKKAVSDYESKILDLMKEKIVQTVCELKFAEKTDDEADELNKLQKLLKRRKEQIPQLAKTKTLESFERLRAWEEIYSLLHETLDDKKQIRCAELIKEELKFSKSKINLGNALKPENNYEAIKTTLKEKIDNEQNNETKKAFLADFTLLSNRIPNLQRLKGILEKEPSVVFGTKI